MSFHSHHTLKDSVKSPKNFLHICVFAASSLISVPFFHRCSFLLYCHSLCCGHAMKAACHLPWQAVFHQASLPSPFVLSLLLIEATNADEKLLMAFCWDLRCSVIYWIFRSFNKQPPFSFKPGSHVWLRRESQNVEKITIFSVILSDTPDILFITNLPCHSLQWFFPFCPHSLPAFFSVTYAIHLNMRSVWFSVRAHSGPRISVIITCHSVPLLLLDENPLLVIISSQTNLALFILCPSCFSVSFPCQIVHVLKGPF